MKRLQGILYVLIICFCTSAFAQDSLRPKIELMGRAQKDQITLRWAASSPYLWKQANTYGMHLERYTILRDGKALNPPELKSYPKLFKPIPLEEWEAVSDNNDYALVAAQAIYGESFEITEDMSSDISRAINQTKELEQRHLFALFAADQSKEVAIASGLMLEDRDVKDNEKYLYTITCQLPEPMTPCDTGFIYIGLEDYFELPAPEGLTAETHDGNVILSWECRRYADFYNSYYVERSDDGGRTFRSITTAPIVTPLNDLGEIPEYIFKGDTVGELNKAYLYRVKGINPFGEVSPPSKTVSATVYPNLIVQPRIIKAYGLDDGSMQILWEFPEAYRDSIVGFKLKRADKINGQYVMLNASLKNSDSLTVDPNPLASNYYLITAYDQYGNESISLPALGMLEDSIPPSAPLGLTGEIDTTGILTLKWNANTENDVLGYRVYQSNFKSEEFVQITNETLLDTVFSDSINLNTLNHEIYYKITAIDGHFNPSGFSQTIAVKRPDIIPPVPAQFKGVSSEEDGIHLSWTPSSSDDVVKHSLYRKSKSDDGWKVVFVVGPQGTSRSYIDTKVTSGTQYAYVLIATDNAGNESPLSQAITATSKSNSTVIDIKQVKANTNRSEAFIEVTWKYEDLGVHKFLIYRAEKDGKLTLIKEIKGSERKFIDKDIEANTKYHYRLQASMNSGILSSFSKEIIVNY